MKCFSVFVLVALIAVASAQEQYSSKYDSIDTHNIVDNNRLFQKYKACIIEDSASGCPQDALELKRVLAEALETTCAKCSPKQQERIKDTLSYMCEKRPEDLKDVLAKIDPTKTFRPAFEAKFGTINGSC